MDENKKRYDKIISRFKKITGHGIVSGTWISHIYSMIEDGYSDEYILKDILRSESIHNNPEFINQVANHLSIMTKKYEEVMI